MMKQVGVVQLINRYPVKSMQGESLSAAHLYWHGLDGDRRYAFVQSDNRSGFPWLTGRQVAEMVLYQPRFTQPRNVINSPISVKLPDGRLFDLRSEDLRRHLATAWGRPVHLLHLGRGTFDSQVLSLMSQATVAALTDLAGEAVVSGRFRQNIIINTGSNEPYQEERWLDRVLTFGSGSDAARIRINRRIQRCAMITIDPETAVQSPEILRMVAQQRDNCVGLYASTERPGTIRVGDPIFLYDSPRTRL